MTAARDLLPPSGPAGASVSAGLFISAGLNEGISVNFAPIAGDNGALPFSVSTVSSSSNTSRSDLHALDQLTGGAFTAPTSGDRAARVRTWLQLNPSQEEMQSVFRELSVKDKGAARLLRERLDEARRQRDQEGLAQEWSARAQTLLDQPRMNIADAMAWQRDAAKAGAPLSREPLAGFKARLADRVKSIEDLQHRVQVEREAAVLLAQRIELLSTKSWEEADAAAATVGADVLAWQAQAAAIPADPAWSSVDPRFAPQLETSLAQLRLVWDAFAAALELARRAAVDPQAELPQVPVWADALRQARGGADVVPEATVRVPADPEAVARAQEGVRGPLDRLEQEISQGHGKASAGAAQALRQALKDHGRLAGADLDRRAHAALAAASELEGWQRWRANQLREELVGRAEALLQRPEGQALGGRKMQETLRELREQWKQTDQGGVPNHALWKRFDEACNQAHKVVEAWLERVRAESAEHRTRRLALIEELKAWTLAQHAAAQVAAAAVDWRVVSRALHQFSDRWRDAGHLSEKAYAELQPLWKEAYKAAGAALDAAQKDSLSRRHGLIDEARLLAEAPALRIDAVKALQQRWQAESHAVPLEHRQEQKLWEAFRKPIDEAFARKSAAREQEQAALGAHDRAVLEASKALEAAIAQGDAQVIRAAMGELEHVTRHGPAAVHAPATESAGQASADGVQTSVPPATEPSAEPGASEAVASPDAAVASETAAPASAAPRKPVVAVRGDDRPGARRPETSREGRDGRGAPRDARNGPRPARAGERPVARPGDRGGDRGGDRWGDRGADREPRGPRLGDAAFRSQRDALERAQSALRRLAAQAHGEAVGQLMAAWEQRDAQRVPTAAELGRINAASRTAWAQALARPAGGEEAGEQLLRLEMAADVPTPADQMPARRALQLQLLTRRHDPSPAQTWEQDVARVLGSPYQETAARRLQSALKALLRR